MSAASSPLRSSVLQAFHARFGSAPETIARAPGRVNLIGEHTDYNDGYVLPLAIDRGVWIAYRRRADRKVSLHSLDFSSQKEFDVDDTTCSSSGWMKYVHAVALALNQLNGWRLHGLEGVIAGDVPIGAGLSSSAALELAAARAFAAAGSLDWNARQMAVLAQRAENVFIGVNCGIMDQMISAAGTEDHALLIDCRTLLTRHVPMPPGTAVVILDTLTRRGLVDSAYNERRMHCEAAAEFLGVAALRDVDSITFAARADDMALPMRKRARHVITENERTLKAADALVNGDVQTLGRLMNESHQSLREDFEVSSAELDGIVEIARAAAGCIGARMTGAGFGGCAVALVESAAASAFVAHVAHAYEQAFGPRPMLYVCTAAPGASVEPVAPGLLAR
ncbi:MAG: galactokinase [Gemmatimonadota bacterium]